MELLPRPMGQDWSEIWLQRFSGTITVWPKSIMSDYWHILSDPSPARLQNLDTGQTLRQGPRKRRTDADMPLNAAVQAQNRRQSSILKEISRQAAVLWHDELPTDVEDGNGTTTDEEDAVVDHEDALDHQ